MYGVGGGCAPASGVRPSRPRLGLTRTKEGVQPVRRLLLDSGSALPQRCLPKGRVLNVAGSSRRQEQEERPHQMQCLHEERAGRQEPDRGEQCAAPAEVRHARLSFSKEASLIAMSGHCDEVFGGGAPGCYPVRVARGLRRQSPGLCAHVLRVKRIAVFICFFFDVSGAPDDPSRMD